jgi:two-component system, NarL family, nitrate/nitrite response regulator NarL
MALPTTEHAVGLARRATHDALATWRLAHVEETAVLLVSALVTNAVRHAQGPFGLALQLRAEPTRLRIEVQDADPRADVVILDLELGANMVTDEVVRLAATQRIGDFPGHADPAVILRVTGDDDSNHLVGSVLAVVKDRSYVRRERATTMLTDGRPERPVLSAQERRVLLLWFQGMSKASVARRMSITENTVRQYINRARMKYATAGRPAPSKDALLARAIEDGIIRPGEAALYTSYAARQPSASTGTDSGRHSSIVASRPPLPG